MGIGSYSTTPGSNTSISGINIAEGCNPSGINDAIRQMMADIASGVTLAQAPTATGTATAIVVTLAPAITSYVTGQTFYFLPSADSTGATTINYGAGVLNLQKNGGLALVAKDLIAGQPAAVLYDGTRAVLLNPAQYAQGAAIASAGTVNLDTATGDFVHITGTTGITAFTLKQGSQKTITFDGIVTMTNSASLILPSGANVTTAAGDTFVLRGEASSVVRVVGYTRANGTAIVASDATLTTTDITTNNFTVTKHGFVPKGTNVGNFLKDDGTWASATGVAPTRQVLTSGTGATYTTPANCRGIYVKIVGGGGGGGSGTSGAGSSGSASTFNSVNANGGGGGAVGAGLTGDGGTGGTGGTGGSGSATLRRAGASGDVGYAYGTGGKGGDGPFATGGGNGGRYYSSSSQDNAIAGVANTGGGGGGGDGGNSTAHSGGGGGAGELAELLITSPSATYTYTVGGGGSGGGSGAQSGKAGGSGVIIVWEYY